MPVGIQQFQQKQEEKESDLDKVIKGLNVAQSAFGIYGTYKNIEKAKADQLLEQEKYKGQRADADLNNASIVAANRAKGLEPSYGEKGNITGFNMTTDALAKQKGEEERGLAKHLADLDKTKAETNKLNAEARMKALGKTDPTAMRGGVPGFGVVSGEAPTKDDAKILKQANEMRNDLNTDLQKLRSLVEEYGTENPMSEVGTRMDSLATGMRLKAKELFNLGVLNGPDLELMSSIIPNPADWTQNINPWAGGNILERLNQAEKTFNQRVDSVAGARGFAARNEGTDQNKTMVAGQGLQAGPPGRVKSEVPIDLQTAAQQELIRRRGLGAVKVPGK
jgi:hypothetical protein